MPTVAKHDRSAHLASGRAPCDRWTPPRWTPPRWTPPPGRAVPAVRCTHRRRVGRPVRLRSTSRANAQVPMPGVGDQYLGETADELAAQGARSVRSSACWGLVGLVGHIPAVRPTIARQRSPTLRRPAARYVRPAAGPAGAATRSLLATPIHDAPAVSLPWPNASPPPLDRRRATARSVSQANPMTRVTRWNSPATSARAPPARWRNPMLVRTNAPKKARPLPTDYQAQPESPQAMKRRPSTRHAAGKPRNTSAEKRSCSTPAVLLPMGRSGVPGG
jgi:hypothetical protein